jgi:putative FmdB family regulatory protein
MPEYEYRCEACRKKITVHQTFQEHDTARVKCPKCSSTKVKRVLATVFAKTSKKS